MAVMVQTVWISQSLQDPVGYSLVLVPRLAFFPVVHPLEHVASPAQAPGQELALRHLKRLRQE